MKTRPLRFARVGLLLLAVGLALAAPSDSSIAARPVQATASMHEARLRKMHLVRPDLFNYPIAFDVIC